MSGLQPVVPFHPGDVDPPIDVGDTGTINGNLARLALGQRHVAGQLARLANASECIKLAMGVQEDGTIKVPPVVIVIDAKSIDALATRLCDAVQPRFANLEAAQKATDQHVTDLGAAQKATDQHVTDLGAAQKATDQHVTDLGAAQKATDEQVTKQGAAQKTTDQHVTDLQAAQKTTNQHVTDLQAAQKATEQHVSRQGEAISGAETVLLGEDGHIRRLEGRVEILAQRLEALAVRQFGDEAVADIGTAAAADQTDEMRQAHQALQDRFNELEAKVLRMVAEGPPARSDPPRTNPPATPTSRNQTRR